MAYGPHPDQTMTVHRPRGAVAGPTVVLLHGGFWWERYRADLMEPLAADLAGRGHPVVNVEYRRVGGAGGWPETFLDVAAALDHLPAVADLPLASVVTVGHSAGGHLAVWAASRHRLSTGSPGADPVVRPAAAVSQAGMVDLAAAARAGLGDGAVADLLGGDPGEVPDRYAVADPAALLPIGVPVLLVHGEEDRIVPAAISEGYRAAAGSAGDPVELVMVPGGHFEALDPTHAQWQPVVERLRGAVRQ